MGTCKIIKEKVLRVYTYFGKIFTAIITCFMTLAIHSNYYLEMRYNII
jgi:hypothetical protein